MPPDVIRLICPNLKCRAILVAPASTRGKSVRCKGCGMKVGVPGAPLPAEPAKPGATR